MGKRQIGELEPSELVITIIISELATIPMQDREYPLLNIVIAVTVLISLEIFSAAISVKSRTAERVLAGQYNIIVENGVINQCEMKKAQLTISELYEEIRQNGAMDINDVKSGSLEYWLNDGSRKKTAKLSEGCAYILNGRVITAGISDAFKPGAGRVVLADNNNDNVYDVAYVERYSYIMVKSYDPVSETIRDTYHSDFTLNVSEAVCIVKNLDGENADILDIAPGNIYRVIKSADGGYMSLVQIEGEEFTEEEITSKAFEKYSQLDSFGRCGKAVACLGRETMPTEERGEIGMINPSGWHLKKYDCVDGKYLYNRCHLIGFQLSGENANDKNLITGTRYLNIEGMLPFENEVAEYIEKTNNHVMYRVTPVFQGENLLCKGVKMEAYSVEDNGKGVCFNVFCYNAQPSIKIDYGTGESYLTATTTTQIVSDSQDDKEINFILNIKSKKYHSPTCPSINKMAEKNKKAYTGTKADLINNGYTPCQVCN